MRKKTQPRRPALASDLDLAILAAIRGGNDLTSGTEDEAAARTKYSNIVLKRG